MARRKIKAADGTETEVETQKFWVVAKQDSRMRAGFAFTREPREVELSEDQHKAISADPMLAFTSPPAKTETAPAA